VVEEVVVVLVVAVGREKESVVVWGWHRVDPVKCPRQGCANVNAQHVAMLLLRMPSLSL
jgi:hypothetical protein